MRAPTTRSRPAPTTDAVVAPTSTSARPASFRPVIELDGPKTTVLVERVGAVDVTRLGELAGRIGPEEQWGIDTALSTVFDLRGS